MTGSSAVAVCNRYFNVSRNLYDCSMEAVCSCCMEIVLTNRDVEYA